MTTANADTQATWAYHDATKHTFASVRSGHHVMDRTNQPRPWKLYANDLRTIELNRNIVSSGVSTLDAISGRMSAAPHPLTVEDVGAVLLLSAGVTKTLAIQGGQMRFRAAACTGALYHIELYLVTAAIEELEAGVYHYGVHDNALRLLREGDFRQYLANATANHTAASRAEAFIVYTTTYWRNAWKYASRAYRHAFWDGGTIIANTLATAGARSLEPVVLSGFVDQEVNRLIGVEPAHESAVAMIALGNREGPQPPSPMIAELSREEIPLSRSEIEFPLILEMHDASCLDEEGIQNWIGSRQPIPTRHWGTPVDLPPPAISTMGVEETIIKRGSTRRFEGSSVSREAFATILESGLGQTPLDVTPPGSGTLVDTFIIVNAVDDLAPGIYFYDRMGRVLQKHEERETRLAMSHLALDQSLGGDAAFNIYFLADLNLLLSQLGNRGYRAAQLDASIAAGRAYLATYSLGLGATGLTFYDDEVLAYLGERAEGLSVMFLLAIGNPARGSRKW